MKKGHGFLRLFFLIKTCFKTCVYLTQLKKMKKKRRMEKIIKMQIKYLTKRKKTTKIEKVIEVVPCIEF